MRLSRKSAMVRGEKSAFLLRGVVLGGTAQRGIARYEGKMQAFSHELLNMVRLYLDRDGTAMSDTEVAHEA